MSRNGKSTRMPKEDEIRLYGMMHKGTKEEKEKAKHELVMSVYGSIVKAAEKAAADIESGVCDVDDMIQEGVLFALENADNFDPARGRFDNYISRYVLFAMNRAKDGIHAVRKQDDRLIVKELVPLDDIFCGSYYAGEWSETDGPDIVGRYDVTQDFRDIILSNIAASEAVDIMRDKLRPREFGVMMQCLNDETQKDIGRYYNISAGMAGMLLRKASWKMQLNRGIREILLAK